jgi:hypothetical protein
MVLRKKLILLSMLYTSLVSCGAASIGGDDGPAPVIEPTVTFTAPSTILAAANPSSSGCTGSSWNDCIKLTANVSDPQNRVTSKNWVFMPLVFNNNCEDPIRTGDTIISCPALCGGSYSLQFYYDINYTMPRSNGVGTYSTGDYISKKVYVNSDQCASGIGVDGYIVDADVFVDLNNNLTMDDGEPRTKTGTQGQFSFNAPVKSGSTLVLIGGTDFDTKLPMPENYILVGIYDSNYSSIISPLSTVNYFTKGQLNLHHQLKVRNEFDILAADPISHLAYDYKSASAVLEKNIQLTILSSVLAKFSKNNNYINAWKIISEPIINNKYELNEITSSAYIKHILNTYFKKINFSISANKIDSTSDHIEYFLKSIKVTNQNSSHIEYFAIGIGEFGDNINQFIKNEVETLNNY